MKHDLQFISNYFTHEKIQCLILIVIGIIAIAAALVFWLVIRYAFYKGMAWPLLLIGILQLTAGFTIYNRCDEDIARVRHYAKHDPEKILLEEIPRIENVNHNFIIYQLVECSLILSGLSFFIFLKKPGHKFWKGLGLGLLIQASVLLAVDFTAAKSGKIYEQNLCAISR